MRCIATLLVITSSALGQTLADFSKVDALIDVAIAEHKCPGAVLLVGRSGGPIHVKACGQRALQPQLEAMTTDTMFDVASLTKPVATATSIMILSDRGRIDLAQTVSHYLPEFGTKRKEVITVEQLLLHFGGLIADNPMSHYGEGAQQAWTRICELEPVCAPGDRFIYSDVGFIVLGKLVERVDGRSLDKFAAEEIFVPLGMNETCFLPPGSWHQRIAPTQKRLGQWMRGEVHDPRAHALGGVAGHAGLFSTAADLARFCRMLLNKGQIDGKRILSAAAVERMVAPHSPASGDGIRCLGFDVKTKYSSPLGERFKPLTSFGHTGFTGTCFWISPPDDLFFVLLTNSVHPDGKGRVVELRKAVSTAVAEAVLGR